MKNEMKKKNNKGFSLVELIVVIAIMAVLMVVLAPAMLRYVEKTRVQKDESAVSEVIRAVELAAAEETIADKIKSGDTIVVSQKADKSGYEITGSAATEVKNEVAATIPKINITSKTYKGKSYTITITVDTDGVISVPEYDNKIWK